MITPLFRLVGHGDHFYTTSVEERDNAIAQYGYVSEGIACYVSSIPDPLANLRDTIALQMLGTLMVLSFNRGESVESQCTRAYLYADALLVARAV